MTVATFLTDDGREWQIDLPAQVCTGNLVGLRVRVSGT
jgi:hypothetical protein